MLIEVKRAYGGSEGKRVRVGERFWVRYPGKKAGPDGVREITPARYQQLSQQRLVAPYDPKSKVDAPHRPRPEPRTRRPAAPVPGAKVEPDSRPPSETGARVQSKEKEPKPVRKLPPPSGSQTGPAGRSSSSPAAPQTGGSTLRQRGTRRGQESGGSPSTTPSASSPGPAPSTPATPNGGGSTAPSPGSEDSTAFA